MSRWLLSVNHLLESLDGQASQIAEEHTFRQQEQGDEEEGTGGAVSDSAKGGALQDILVKRGLSSVGSDEEDNDDDGEEEEQNPTGSLGDKINQGVADDMNVDGWKDDGMADVEVSEHPEGNENEQEDFDDDDAAAAAAASEEADIETPSSSLTAGEQTDESNGEDTSEIGKIEEPSNVTVESLEVGDKHKEMKDAVPPSSSNTDPANGTATMKKPRPPPPRPILPPPSKPAVSTTPASSSPTGSSLAAAAATATAAAVALAKKNKKELSEAQKEARTLRRHVVALNTQLEAAEAEMKAQRIELEQAAERMEKDRVLQKTKAEQIKTKQAQDLQALKQQHDQVVQETERQWQAQMDAQQAQLKYMEAQLRQEGGDLNKELVSALDREQEMIHLLEGLRDEKSILESQINTLQSQQEALGSRLESLTQTADNAMDREREAQDRLDSTLEQHAKQISQRQAREAELERSIQDLGAALVVARNRATKSSSSFSEDSVGENAAASNDVSVLRARIDALECDLETANAHLKLERERSETMHQELRDMSKESTQEASAIHAKQVHYDRQIADLSLTISKLQASLREAKRDNAGENESGDRISGKSNGDDDAAEQVKMLSDEVVRLRDRVASHSSESLAMRNRLKEAVDRASHAEEKLAMVMANGIESGGGGDGMSHNSGNAPSRRRRGVATSPSGSLRSVMKLNPGQGERREQIGKAVDVVDVFAKTTAKYIRQNPFARAGFIAYFLLIHFWTFVVLFLHAHSFDPGRTSDFGSIPHGPHAMVQQHQDQIQGMDPAIAAAQQP